MALAAAYGAALLVGGIATYINAPSLRLLMPGLLLLPLVVWQGVRHIVDTQKAP